jgi:ActR/RegA family two-component response regulator
VRPRARAAPRPSIVIIDADAAAAERLAISFDRIGWSASAVEPGAALPLLRQQRALVTVLVARGEDELTLLRALKDVHRPTRAVVVLDRPRVDMAVAAVRSGAAEVLVEPVDAEKVLQALEAYRRRRETEDLRLGVVTDNAIEDAIADSDGDLTEAAFRLGVSRRCLELRRAKAPTRLYPRRSRPAQRVS